MQLLDGGLHFDPLYHENDKNHISSDVILYTEYKEYKEKTIKIG
jgi:hypothetical protein